MATFSNPNFALYAFVSRLRAGDPKARATSRALVQMAHRGDARARARLSDIRAIVTMQQGGMRVGNVDAMGGLAQQLPKLKAAATKAKYWAARPLHWTFGTAGKLINGTGTAAALVLEKTAQFAARPFQFVEHKLAPAAATRLPAHVQLPR